MARPTRPSPSMHPRPHPSQTSAGFTLLEVMLALAALAILSGLSWQGLSTLLATRQGVQAHTDAAHSRDLSLAQWRLDWHHLWTEANGTRLAPLQWNGQHLILIRRAPNRPAHTDAGLQVVAWTTRDGQWWRWASAPVTRQGDLLLAWQAASLWTQQGQDTPLATALLPARSWRLLLHRGGAWTNPASDDSPSADRASGSAPEAIRLELLMGADQALTVDLASPTLALERP